jgi:hypothetical protein
MTDHHYETSDFYLASYLHYSGCSLTDHLRVSPRRVVFRFVSDEKLHEVLRVYWRNQPVPVVPLQLFASFRRLKSITRAKPESAEGQEPTASPLLAGDTSDLPYPSLPC